MNKQRMHLLVLIISALLVVSSCSDSQSSDIRSMERLKGDTDEKISLVITDIDNKNCSAELAVVNHTGNSVCYGESFYIQRRSGNGRKLIIFKRMNAGIRSCLSRNPKKARNGPSIGN